MRGLRSLLLVSAAVAAAASAAAAPASHALIRPGKGIGKARLGMSEAAVSKLQTFGPGATSTSRARARDARVIEVAVESRA